MPGTTSAYDFRGRTVLDSAGDKIGKIEDVYTDRQGGQPEWALVHTGLFGTKRSFVPIRSATPTGEDVRVPVSKAQVKDAPQIDPDAELSEAEERTLFEHYGIPYTSEGSTTAVGSPGTASVGDEDAMTRSEEELHVGTERRESGRVRLRKYVVTEEVTRTVPVQREEIRVEREPITEENVEAATSGPAISEAEHEVVLYEEEPVVEKRVVPKERVRLEKDTQQSEEEISEQLRKERIETEQQ
jgi:uncharacterized protein (TIGR02271 family)